MFSLYMKGTERVSRRPDSGRVSHRPEAERVNYRPDTGRDNRVRDPDRVGPQGRPVPTSRKLLGH